MVIEEMRKRRKKAECFFYAFVLIRIIAQVNAAFFTYNVKTSKSTSSRVKASILPMTKHDTHEEGDMDYRKGKKDTLSRRSFGSVAAIAILGIGAMSPTSAQTTVENPSDKERLPNVRVKTFEPVDIRKVVQENKINVTVYENNTKVYLNSTSFEKVREPVFPSWWPRALRPQFKPFISETISDKELLAATAMAGSTTEVARTSLLYPITTVKTRIQASPSMGMNITSLGELGRELVVNIVAQTKAGDLYSGFLPSLLISAPSAGIYYAVYEDMKRTLRRSALFDDLGVVLTSVLVADVVSLAFRTPAVIFSVRKQAEKTINMTSVEEYNQEGDLISVFDVEGDLEFPQKICDPEQTNKVNKSKSFSWLDDSLQQLPVVIVTDLPYRIMKISVMRAILSGSESMLQYDVFNIAAAIFASALTTPFDVARTRILVDSDCDPSNGLDGGTGESIFEAMNRTIYESGEAKIENLYKGWAERVFYFGIGIAWLEPIRLICYNAIRDSILLKIFSIDY